MMQNPQGLAFNYNGVQQFIVPSPSSTTTSSISFYLNGKLVNIQNPDPSMTLLDYLRYYTPYKGVKQHCRQGGCGVCAVMTSYYDSDSGIWRNVSLNACLHLLVTCDGTAVWTTEGIKISSQQYHPIQERIAKTYGLQCGACTTAQVMTQYTALQPGTFMQRNQYEFLEKNFDGNLCRCSCYPGIIKMARSFLPPGLNGSPQVYDSTGALIGWDLNATGPASATTGTDDGFYSNLGNLTSSFTQLNPKGFLLYNPALDVNATSAGTGAGTIADYLKNTTLQSALFINKLKNFNYYRSVSLADTIRTIQTAGVSSVKVVAAGTSWGIPGYGIPNPNTVGLYIDINNVPELHTTVITSTGATFGANVAINKVVSRMFSGASSDLKFNAIANHLFYISGQHVRNIASICGGLVMAKQGHFSSDVAPVMIAANATLNCTYIYPSYTQTANLTIEQYLNLNISGFYCLINSITIPSRQTNEVFWSYRLAQRYFNSHAWLNAAVSYNISSGIISNTKIAFGALDSGVGVARATTAETYLNGKDISSASAGATGALNTIISGALSAIATDVNSLIAPIEAFNGVGGDGKVQFRKNLALTLWYLSFLNLLKSQNWLGNYAKIQKSLETWISGTPESTRLPNLQFADLSQVTIKSDYPAHYGWPRLDAIQIASGEVRYNDDMQIQIGQLWGASALTKIAVGEIDWTSPTTIASLAEARNTPGVEYVVTVFDLYNFVIQNNDYNSANQPGYTVQSITGANFTAGASSQETFANQFINHYGQRVAIVLSEDFELAQRVADRMVFGYKNQFTGYANSVIDAVNKGYVMNNGTTNNGYNNTTYNRQATEVVYNWPYTGGNNSYDLNPSTITYNPSTYQNLLPRSSNMTGFIRPDGSSYTGYYYTGAGGQLLPWSDYVLESTGAYTAEKYQMALERLTSNCYLDENGCYNMYSTHQFQNSGITELKKLGLLDYQLRLKARRIAGAFGQKLSYTMNGHVVSTIVCCWVAKGRLVRLVPSLQEDSQMNGAESETWSPYKVAFNSTGTINSTWLNSYMASNYGANPAWKALSTTVYPSTAADGFTSYMDAIKNLFSYFQNNFGLYMAPNAAAVPRPFRCAYRGPYGQVLNYVYGDILDNISAITGRSFTDISYLNAPQATWWPPFTTNIPINQDRYEWRTMMDRFLTQPQYDYTNRLAQVNAFNAANKYVKRAIEIYFGKYEVNIMTSANSDSLIKIQPDGTVLLYLSYTESGQGGTIKACQLVSSKLKVPLSMIKVVEYDHNLIWGDTGNGGSRGTNTMLRGVEDACNKVLARFAPNLTGAANGDVLAYNLFNTNGTVNPATINLSALMTGSNGLGTVTGWKSLVSSQSSSFYWVQTGTNAQGIKFPTNANPNLSTNVNTLIFQGKAYDSALNGTGAQYNLQNVLSKTPTYIASMSEVEVNMLSGNVNPLRVDIIGDVGNSPNPNVDLGQIYGGYIYSLGMSFKEERTWNTNMQSLITDTWEYKPPCNVDIPSIFNCNFYGFTGPYSVINQTYTLDGKGITECAAMASNSTFFAAKTAIREFRKQELGNTLASRKFDLTMPATPDRIQAAAGLTSGMLNMNS